MTEWSQPDQAERFVREYADPILRVCAAYSLGRSDAQDICQDIFLTRWRKHGPLTPRTTSGPLSCGAPSTPARTSSKAAGSAALPH